MQVNNNYAVRPVYETAQTQRTETFARNGSDYLQDLVSRYPQASFSTQDFASAGDIKSYAMSKSGQFNDVAISPHALDKFANDPAAAAEMEALLKEFLGLEQRARDTAEALGATDAARGMVVNKNGEASFWMSGTVTKGSGRNNMFDRLLPNPSAAERRKTAETERKKASEKAAEEKKFEEKRAEEREEREMLLGLRAGKTVFTTSRNAAGLALSFAEMPDSGVLDVTI